MGIKAVAIAAAFVLGSLCPIGAAEAGHCGVRNPQRTAYG
jgi:hypothetical protein